MQGTVKFFLLIIKSLRTYPWILPCPNHLASQLDKLCASNDGERNVRVHGVVDLVDGFIVCWELINFNTVRLQLFVDFCLKRDNACLNLNKTALSTQFFTLNFCNSVLEIVSALAIIGMMLTFLSNFFMQTKSKDFSPWPVGQMKYKQM